MSEAEVVTKSLLEYVPDLLEEVEQLQAEADRAQAEMKTIDAKILETELAFERRRTELVKPDRSRVLAQAALAGVKPPQEQEDPPGLDPRDLETTLRGLRAMRKEPESRAEDLQVAVRVKTIHAFREAAERAGPDLLECAKRLAALHAEIGAAQRMVECFGTGQGPGCVVGLDWWDLLVPTSGQIKALQPTFQRYRFRQVIVGDDREGLNKAATAAFEAARSEVRRRLGGRWPLDKRG